MPERKKPEPAQHQPTPNETTKKFLIEKNREEAQKISHQIQTELHNFTGGIYSMDFCTLGMFIIGA